MDSRSIAIALACITHGIIRYYEPSTAVKGLGAVTLLPFMALTCGLVTSSTLSFTFHYISFLIASVVFYRISPFHSLSHIPGPFLYKISKLTGMWISWSGTQHLVLRRMHEKYGPIVRIGPNDVSVVDVDAIPAVLGASGLPKGSYYSARRDPRAPNSLITMNGEDHANRRRIWNRGMSSESLREYEKSISLRATQLLHKLEGSSGGVDLARWLGYFSFDVMGDMAFGGGFELMRDDGDSIGILDAIHVWAIAASIYSHVPWCAATLANFHFSFRDTMRDFALTNAMRRVKMTATDKDLWYHLMDEAGLEKEKPPLGNVVADGATAVVAGSDTTSMALASLFFLLLSYPEQYQRLQEEIDATFPPGSDPMDISKHANMKYLNACINETLRLYPPVPTNGPRQVPFHSKGKMIASWFIPSGTQVYLPPYVYHRDPRYFSPDPDSFVPERWLQNGTEPNAFIPFSYGPSNCVGKHFARQEMTMVTCLLLQHLSFAFAPNYDVKAWLNNLEDHFISTRGSLQVVVNRR